MRKVKSPIAVAAAPGLWLLALTALITAIQGVLASSMDGVAFADVLAMGEASLRFSLTYASIGGAALFVLLLALPAVRQRRQPAPLPRVVPWLAALGLLAAFGLAWWPPPRSGDRRPDVYLIVVDTLRADFATRERMPHLFELVDDGVRFTDAFASSPWTLPSFGSMLTGLHPEQHGAGQGAGPGRLGAPMRDDVPTLPAALRAVGYQTSAVVTNAYLVPEAGLTRGFEHYSKYGAFRLPFFRPETAPLVFVPAPEQQRRGALWLRLERDARRPLFMLQHFMDPHMPRKPSQRWLAAEQRAHPEASPARQAYGAMVRYVDAGVGAFIADLRRSGRYAHALIIVASDHGEEVDDGRSWTLEITDHGHSLFPEVMRTALVVKLPRGRGAGTTCGGLATLRAIPATIAEVTGQLDPAEWPMPALLDADGRCARPPDIVFHGAMLYGPPQNGARTEADALFWQHEPERLLAFDRVRDPELRTPLASPSPAVLAPLQSHVARFRSATPPPAREIQMTPADRNALRALGYVQ